MGNSNMSNAWGSLMLKVQGLFNAKETWETLILKLHRDCYCQRCMGISNAKITNMQLLSLRIPPPNRGGAEVEQRWMREVDQRTTRGGGAAVGSGAEVEEKWSRGGVQLC